MRRTAGWWAVGVGAVLLLQHAAVLARDGKDKKVPLDRVPKAIRDAIDGRFPGATVRSVEKETDDGKVVFDVELTHRGRKYEMDILENGTVVEIEKEVAPADVPAAVRQAVKAKFPQATIQEVMEVNKVQGKEEKPQHYEVTIQAPGQKTQEVIVSLDGKSIRREGQDQEKP
jgi:hypothetical protein